MQLQHAMKIYPSVAVALVLGGTALGCKDQSQTMPTQGAASPAQEPQGGVGVTEQQGPDAVPLPAGAMLIGTSAVTEIRAFPEQMQAAKGSGAEVETTVGVKGVDRVYQTDATYADVVSFYDRKFGNVDRTATPTTTTWSVQRADWKPGRLAVRNTNPTTIEVIAVTGEGPTVSVPPGQQR